MSQAGRGGWLRDRHHNPRPGPQPRCPDHFFTAAIDQPEQPFRSYAAGAVDYLAKPFDPWVLKAKVSVFVDLYLKRGEPALDELGR